MTMGATTAKRAVTMIPARAKLVPLSTQEVMRRLRVAAYARVSTNDEEQQTSYEKQIEWYTNYIQSHKGWKFVGMYADVCSPYGQIPKSLVKGDTEPPSFLGRHPATTAP